ncbi:PHB depolymerase family esterase [Marinivivus vitaminiproducens]|nr:PHB depolymerase family esterase [Geminicoccaceae bacterium SCSIO 64248]
MSQGRPGLDAFGSLPGMGAMARPPAEPLPDGARFTTRSFACAAGSRGYKLYIPAACAEERPPLGLVVLLHGCQQNPDDFALGTGMNALAEIHGLLVAYPGQTSASNASSCWNWFNPADQRRDAGEPAILAGITREVMREFGLDREQVFVAGLSAGGAMAAILAATYPDLYAAVGVHSGLAHGSASDVVSAFAAMRGDGGAASHDIRNRTKPSEWPVVRTIVFHGSADRTVHPVNAQRIVEAAGLSGDPMREHGRSPGGRAYERTITMDAGGHSLVESWLIEGAGHAWSGGRAGGSYTDPSGPDASTAMVRFFLDF